MVSFYKNVYLNPNLTNVLRDPLHQKLYFLHDLWSALHGLGSHDSPTDNGGKNVDLIWIGPLLNDVPHVFI